jgi:hypothetical protein
MLAKEYEEHCIEFSNTVVYKEESGQGCEDMNNTWGCCCARPGADPMADLLALAEEKRMSKRFEKVSLGQGQGPKAERLLDLGMEQGLWVCLQNCHLAVSWMPSLERIVQNIQPEKV